MPGFRALLLVRILAAGRGRRRGAAPGCGAGGGLLRYSAGGRPAARRDSRYVPLCLDLTLRHFGR
jgi:hypothetical protein